MNLENILKKQDIDGLNKLIEEELDVSTIEFVKFIDEIEKPNIEFIEKLLNSGIDINQQDEEGDTALMVACAIYDIELIKLFLRYDADISIKSNNDWSALELAIEPIGNKENWKGYEQYKEIIYLFLEVIEDINVYADELLGLFILKDFEIIEHLISCGFDVNFKDKEDITPLLCTLMPIIPNNIEISNDIQVEKIVKLLIENGVDINIKIRDEYSLFVYILMMSQKTFQKMVFLKKIWLEDLFSLFEFDKKKIFQLFIENGVDINKEKLEGMPLIFIACLFSDIETIEFLIENGADINIKIKDKTSLFVWILMMTQDMFKLFVFQEETDREEILFLFSKFNKNKIKILQLLIKNGVDLNKERMVKGEPLLHQFCIDKNFLYERKKEEMSLVEKESSKMLINTLPIGDINMIKFFLENGADVNGRNDEKWTPLMKASKEGNFEIVKILLEYNAEVNLQNNIGESALFLAFRKKKFQILKLLLENGADVNIENRVGVNVGLFVHDKKTMQLLHRYGIKESSVISKEKKYKNTQTPTQIKTNKKSHEEFIKNLKDLTEELSTKSKKEKNIPIKTPMGKILESREVKELIELIDSGYDVSYVDIYDLISLNYPIEFIELILINNGNPNSLNKKEDATPLLLAVKNENLELIKLLVQYGADIDFKDKSGREIWTYAEMEHEILEVLFNPSKYLKRSSHQPKKLVNLLTNFTIDTPIKYTTHLWDFGDITKEYGDFQGFIDAVTKQWGNIEKELKELSPHLHEKIYSFLLNKRATTTWCSQTDISIGWSSLEGLESWCNRGNNPFEFKLKQHYEVGNQTITTFGEVINLFKKEIEIRNENNHLENIFLEQKRKLGRKFNIELTKLKGRSFYTDVEYFQRAISQIFEEIKKRNSHHQIQVEVIEPDGESIEIHILQIDSYSHRTAKEMLNEIKNGDFKIIKEQLSNLCDWSIEGSDNQENYRIHYLQSSTLPKIQKLTNTIDGFRHILRFYK